MMLNDGADLNMVYPFQDYRDTSAKLPRSPKIDIIGEYRPFVDPETIFEQCRF
jgi:hypothetical protein